MQVRNHSGFTLIEMMVSLVVLAVLVSLAAPSFRDLLDKSRLRGATDDVVNMLNTSRTSAVKLQRDVNVSVKGTTSWCVGARSALDPTNVGDAIPAATACDCTATTTTCLVKNQGADQNAILSSGSFSGVTLSNVATAIAYSSGASGEGITFNSKFGAIDLSSAPSTTTAIMTVVSPSGKYSTRIFVYPLGQTYVCSVSKFLSGYPTC